MQNTQKYTVTLLGALMLAATAAINAAAPKAIDKPNVVVILADDLGWADLSCYGSTFHESPNLDKLAKEGVRFTDAYASANFCSPTRAALLTGRSPARLRITNFIPGSPRSGKYQRAEMRMELPLEEVTIAELLKDAGYATWSVGKWHLGKEGFFPENQGFEINIAGDHSGMPASFFWPYGWDMPETFNVHNGSPVPGLEKGGQKGEHLCDRITSEAINLMEKRDPGQPFFLYLSFYDVHTPIQAKPELIKKYEAKAKTMGIPLKKDAKKRYEEGNADQASRPMTYISEQCDPVYAGMVETMDDNVGRILAKLDVLGIADNTLVIFTSDNGGLGGETSNHPLRAGKGWLYEGAVRVPWIVRLPGTTKPGSDINALVISSDIPATILDVCGLPARPELHLDGTSILPLLKGESKSIHEALYWHFPHYGGTGPCSSIRSGNWKLIEFLENDSVELFNLADDLGEWTDVAQKNPEIVNRLREQLHVWRTESGANMLRPLPAGEAVKPAASKP